MTHFISIENLGLNLELVTQAITAPRTRFRFEMWKAVWVQEKAAIVGNLKFESILWQLKILETIGRTAVPLWVSADCFIDSLISKQAGSRRSIWASGRDRPSDWRTRKTNHRLTSASSLNSLNPVLNIWQWVTIVLNRLNRSIDDFRNSRWAKIDISRGRAHPKWKFWHWILRIHIRWYRHDQCSRL